MDIIPISKHCSFRCRFTWIFSLIFNRPQGKVEAGPLWALPALTFAAIPYQMDALQF